MKPINRRTTLPTGHSSRQRGSSTPSTEGNETTMGEDSSANQRPSRPRKKKSAAMMQRDEGERENEESDELRGERENEESDELRGGDEGERENEESDELRGERENEESDELRGERENEESDELRGGSDESIQDEVSSSEEIIGVGSGMRIVKEEPNDGEMERLPSSEMDGQMLSLRPANRKRRSQATQRFEITAYAQRRPRVISTMSFEERQKKQQQQSQYKRLTEKSKKLGSHMKKEFKKRSEDDQDMSVVDPMIDVEVFENGPRENAAIWDAKANSGGSGNEWQLDYLVARERRSILEPQEDETQVLIKWTGYPRPTWEPIKQLRKYGDAIKEFGVRMAELDCVEHNLRSTLGDDEFQRKFPHRYLKREKGIGCYGYVRYKRSLYVNKLRAIESRWNVVNERAGLPPVYIEDWTNQPEDYQSLERLVYINYLVMTALAKRKVTAVESQLTHIKCLAGCVGCVGKKRDDHKSCCCAKSKEVAAEFVRVECTSACGCDSSCKNRMVQTGRQMRLCVFREPNKGWGARALREILNNEYVEEYTGEMGLGPGNFIYDFRVAFSATEMHRSGKKLFTLTNRAGEKGNVARFFNHSCEPNLHADNVLIERYGRFYLHIGFFAARKIQAGEELTFQYFQGNVRKMIAMLPNGCKCGAKKCLVPLPSQIARQGEEEDDEEDEEDEEESEEEEEEDYAGGEEANDGMQPQVENEEMGGPLPRERRTREPMTEMEEQSGGRRRNGPDARSDFTDDESEGENRVTIRRRPSARRFNESMDENLFASPRESPSRENVGGGGEESGRANGRSHSVGGSMEQETQSQEEGERNNEDMVVRKKRGRKKGTVVKKTSQKVTEEPKVEVIDVSSDDEEEKERLREILREKNKSENGTVRAVTRGLLRKSILEEREKKVLNIKRERVPPMPLDDQSPVGSAVRRGIKREIEDHEEDGSGLTASTIKKRQGKVKIETD